VLRCLETKGVADVAMPGATDRVGAGRSSGRLPRRRVLLSAIVPLIALALMVSFPLPRSKAVDGGLPTAYPTGQVRIFENGEFLAGGTLVDRNWVLTVSQYFERLDSTAYSLRFGVVNDHDDGSDTSNLRAIDRIVLHPQAPDLALVHFADPVPSDTWIPSLAAGAPQRYAPARFFSWGRDGHVLSRVRGPIIDPVATANAAVLREDDSIPSFAWDFPSGIDPMVVGVGTRQGDAGSGTFSRNNAVLLGVHAWRADYRYTNESGNLVGDVFIAAYDQPVWQYRDWIQQVISGEGTSGSAPSHDELRRRRLMDRTMDGNLPMTMPPQGDMCDPGQSPCTTPDSTWQAATLVGYSQNQGTVLSRCAQADGNTCTFDGVNYVGGATARLPLGAVGVTGARQVMVWCKSSTALNVGDPPQPVLEVSFTNGDDPQGPVGMGWWLVSPDHVTTDTTTPVDPTAFVAC
jgi:hypothetical protein